MKTPLKLRTFQIGKPRKLGEGLRIGTVRYVPHGTKKKDYAKLDFFDVWFPSLAPSQKLMQWAKTHDLENADHWETFTYRYECEMTQHTESRQALILLAEIAKKTTISIGCYCEDESGCHRSILLKLIQRAATSKFQHALKNEQ